MKRIEELKAQKGQIKLAKGQNKRLCVHLHYVPYSYQYPFQSVSEIKTFDIQCP